MRDFDVAPTGPLHVYLDDDLLAAGPAVQRVRAEDLRGIAHCAAAARAARPDSVVLVDITVLIADRAAAARARLAATPLIAHGTLAYVGTPTGLAGLVADIHALGIADGAVLIPHGGNEIRAMIRGEVLPALETMASAIKTARPA